jgi:hypothetical protein
MSDTLTSFGVPVQNGVIPDYGGKQVHCNPKSGRDSWDGLTKERAVKTFKRAYDLLEDSIGDILVLWGYKDSTGFALLPTATVNAHTNGFDWAKNNTHLIGISGHGREGRASVRLGTGDITTTTMFRVTGNCCDFINVDFLQESTGAVNQIAVQVSGQRNYFQDCTIAGMAGINPWIRAGGRSLKIVGDGTGTDYGAGNIFLRCHIGLNTIVKGNYAAAEIELAGTAARNEFYNCNVHCMATSGGTNGNFFVLVPAAGLQDYVLFDSCKFINSAWTSGAGLMAAGFSVSATAGGVVAICNGKLIGATDWSSSDSRPILIDPQYDGSDLTTVGPMVVPTQS